MKERAVTSGSEIAEKKSKGESVRSDALGEEKLEIAGLPERIGKLLLQYLSETYRQPQGTGGGEEKAQYDDRVLGKDEPQLLLTEEKQGGGGDD